MNRVEHLSVSHLTALDASPELFVRAASTAAFDAVGLRINPPLHTPAQWPIAGDRERTRLLHALIDDLGLMVLETECFPVGPTTNVATLLPGLEASATLGARFVLSTGVDPVEARMVERYGELCAAAATFGLKVAMEFISWNPMRTLQDALRVLGKVGADNAGVLIDFLHLARTGGTASEVAQIPDDRIAYVQICDAPATLTPGMALAQEARARRYYPGDGQLPLADILRALPEAIPLALEAPAANYADRSAADRIRIAAEVTRAFLAAHPERRDRLAHHSD